MTTLEQKQNLKKLADYLLTLPNTTERFDMRDFIDFEGESVEFESATDLVKDHPCGTVACALGFGLEAGIEPAEGCLTWWDYAAQFVDSARQDSWLFSSFWWGVDNTPHGAAYRILYMLEHGAPYPSQMYDL